MTKFMDEIQEKVAAGLRNMQQPPAAFLFCDGVSDWNWDMPDIHGIPVYHVDSMIDGRWGGQSEDILFVPIWKGEADPGFDRKRFIAGYEDYQMERGDGNRRG